MKHPTKNFLYLVNAQLVIVTVLAIFSTYLSKRFAIEAEFPLTLVATAVVFPVVFSIGEAYKRRESALQQYAVLKAHGRALYFASRDWIDDRGVEQEGQLKDILGDLFTDSREYFATDGEAHLENERKVYDEFSDLSLFIRGFRERGMSGSEISRTNQYLCKMMDAFETMKHIYQYRTPKTLRVYSKFFIYVLPVVYGPYFAFISLEFTAGWLLYVTPFFFSIILVSLYNIQDQLENPFDSIGEDDVMLNAEKFVENLGSGNVLQ